MVADWTDDHGSQKVSHGAIWLWEKREKELYNIETDKKKKDQAQIWATTLQPLRPFVSRH